MDKENRGIGAVIIKSNFADLAYDEVQD